MTRGSEASKTQVSFAACAIAFVMLAYPSVSQARLTCADVYGSDPCPSNWGGDGSVLLDAKEAPASVGGTTRESWNNMVPRTEVPQLRTGPISTISNLIGTGAWINQAGSQVMPRGLKTCLQKSTQPLEKAAESAAVVDAKGQPDCGGPGSRGGHVDNLRWNYVHTGVDYATGDTHHCAGAGCSGVVDDLPGQMQRLTIKRIHRPLYSWWRSSFGPGVFSEFDASLQLEPPGSGLPAVVTLYDPDTDAGYMTFYETSTGSGVYQDTATHMYKSMELFQASGAHADTVYDAVSALLTMQTGETWLFDIFNQQSGGEGRLTQKRDRNGNAVVVSYQFPANATSAQMGGDPTQIWNMSSITDPYGAKATVTYTNPNYIWSIASIALPNSTSLTYTYTTSPPAGGSLALTQVNYPNGDISSFAASIDYNLQEVVLSYDDTSTPEDYSQFAYLTQSSWVSPSGNVYYQEPGVVRSILNPDGEQVYKNWEDPTQANIFYVFNAPGKITRINTASSAVGYPSEVANADGTYDSSVDPISIAFDPETYQADANSSMTQRSTSTGYAQNFTRDLTTRAITAVKYPSSVQATATFNGFRQPTSITDVNGVKHTMAYDAKGNMTNATVASGTSVQSAWTSTYNSHGQPLTVTDANGNVTTYGYDSKGDLTSIKDPPDVAGGSQATKTYTYDSSGRVTAMTDALGHKTSYAYDTRGRLNKITYPDSTSESYAYATYGPMSDYTNRNGIKTHYDYDASIRLDKTTQAVGKPEQLVLQTWHMPGSTLVQTEEKYGTLINYGYDQFNNLFQVETQTRGYIHVDQDTIRDVTGLVQETIDVEGFKTYYLYDSQKRVKRLTRELVIMAAIAPSATASLTRSSSNPVWAIKDYTYDNAGHVATYTDELGTVTTNTYDQQGRLNSTIVGSGTTAQTTKYAYDAAGNQTKVIRARTFTSEGNGTDSYRDEMTYTGRNLLKTRTEAAGRTEAVVVATLTYSLTQQKATLLDGNGKTTTYKYDTNDRLSEVDDPLGHSTKYTYDGNGNTLTSTDGNGHKTAYTYDGLNRITKTTNPAGEATTVTYDVNLIDGSGLDAVASGLGFTSYDVGSASQTTDASGVATVSVKDGLGRVVRQGKYNPPLSQTTTTLYENGLLASGSGNVVLTTVQDGRGDATTYAKDGNGASRQITDRDDFVTTYAVNARGQNLSVRKPTGVGFDWTLDAFGRQTSQKDTQGSVNGTTYDVENNVTVTTNPLSKTNTFTYDGRNQKVTATDELGHTTTYAYDGMHHTTSMVDAEARLTQYQYDADGSKTKMIDSDNVSVAYAYDAGERLTSMTDQLGHATTYAYDSADRMTGRSYSDALNDSFTYDKGSRLLTGKSGRYSNTITRTYDGDGNLKTEKTTSGSLNLTTTYAYDANGNVSQVTYPNGSVLLPTYDNQDQLTKSVLDGTTVASYTLDSGGRPTATAFGNGTAEARAYRLDDLVSSVTLKKGSTSLVNLSYTYDANKRKTAETNGLTSTESQAFTYDDADRPATWAQGSNTQSWALTATGDWTSTTQNGVLQSRTYDNAHALKTVASVAVTTDATGAITKDDTGATYTWDFDHQLKSATVAGATTSYAWDALGRRLSKVVGSTTTVFANEGAREDARALAEYDNGAFARLYVYGDGARDEVAVMKAGTAKYYFTHGAQYSVQAVSNDSGTVAERYRYNTFGLQTVLNAAGSAIAATTIANHVGFTGRYHDETGLVFYRTRMLSPRLGRFVSRDSDFYEGPNLYVAYFVPNDMDPSGQCGITSPLDCGKKLVKAVNNDVIQPIYDKADTIVHSHGFNQVLFYSAIGAAVITGVACGTGIAAIEAGSVGLGTPASAAIGWACAGAVVTIAGAGAAGAAAADDGEKQMQMQNGNLSTAAAPSSGTPPAQNTAVVAAGGWHPAPAPVAPSIPNLTFPARIGLPPLPGAFPTALDPGFASETCG